MIFEEIYETGDEYYYIKYGSKIPINIGTKYNLNEYNVAKYMSEGYRLYNINDMKVLTKRKIHTQ